MRHILYLATSLSFALVSCEPRNDHVMLGRGQNGDDEGRRPIPMLSFRNARPGEWAEFEGVVLNRSANSPRQLIRYRFEARESERPDDDSLTIAWSNDDHVTGVEFGSYDVPRDGPMTWDDYLSKINGILGGGSVIAATHTKYAIGQRTFDCYRISLQERNEYGSSTSTIWLSDDAPVAKIVACRSRWRPAAAWQERAPPAYFAIELRAFGNDGGQVWSRDP